LKHASKTIWVALTLLGGRAVAAPDAAAASAELAATHIAAVSSALATFQKELNSTAESRARHILSVRTVAYNGRQQSDREVDVLKQTDGTELVKLFEALREHGDKAALASSKAEAAEATAKAEIAAAYTPLEISTEKLDKAAKTLAALARQQSDSERAAFLAQFLKDTRDETKKLIDESKKASDKADKKLASTAAAAATSSAAASNH
jgi:ferritin